LIEIITIYDIDKKKLILRIPDNAITRKISGGKDSYKIKI